MGYGNFQATKLSTDIGASDNTIKLDVLPKDKTGAVITSGRLVLEARSADRREIIRYTGIDLGTVSVTGVLRGQGGIAAKPHLKGALVEMNPTAEDFEEALGLSFAFPTGIVLPYAGNAAPTGWLFADGSAVSSITYPALAAVVGTTFNNGSEAPDTFRLPDMRGRTPVGAGAAATKVAKVVSRSGNVLTLSGINDTNSNEFQTGSPVVYNVTGTTIGGLVNGTTYYIRRTGNKTISLSTSQSNAVNGSVITLSSDGAGDRTFTLSLTARPLGETGGEERHSLITAEQASHAHSPTSGAANWIHNQTNNPGVAQTNFGNGQLGASAMNSSGGNQDHNIMQPFVSLNYIIKV